MHKRLDLSRGKLTTPKEAWRGAMLREMVKWSMGAGGYKQSAPER